MRKFKFNHYKTFVLIINYAYILSGICMLGFVLLTLCSFKKYDPPEKQKEVIQFIKDNMNKMNERELMWKLQEMNLSGDVEYTWNPKTGEVRLYSRVVKVVVE